DADRVHRAGGRALLQLVTVNRGLGAHHAHAGVGVPREARIVVAEAQHRVGGVGALGVLADVGHVVVGDRVVAEHAHRVLVVGDHLVAGHVAGGQATLAAEMVGEREQPVAGVRVVGERGRAERGPGAVGIVGRGDLLPVPAGAAGDGVAVGVAHAHAQVAQEAAVVEVPAQVGAPGELVGVVVVALVQVRVPAAVVGDVAHVAGDRLPGLVVHGHGRVAAGQSHAHRRNAVEPGPAAPVVRVHLAGQQVHPVVHALGGGVDVLEVGGQVQVGIDLPLAAQGDVGGHRVAPV